MQTLTFVPALLPAALIAPAGAHRARGSAVDVTGKVSNSGARPPETGFTLCCVRGGKIRVIVARLFHSLPFSSFATDMHRTLHPVRTMLNIKAVKRCLSYLSKIDGMF